jgi:protein-disulfide isomerase
MKRLNAALVAILFLAAAPVSQATETAQEARLQPAAGDRETVLAHAAQIFEDRRDPSVGPKDAKTVIALFSDYQCGHCKAEAAPGVAKLLEEHSDIRIVFKEYPIFGARSQSAARLAIAAARQGRYLPVFQAMMATPQLSEAQMDRILGANGVDLEQAHATARSPAVQVQLDDVTRLAHALGVDGTPTFVVGDRMIVGADMDQLEQAIGRAPPRHDGSARRAVVAER